MAITLSQPVGRITAGGMLRINTPVEDYRTEFGLWVKREDKACPPPGPPFSKTRGVYAWVAKQEVDLIGVLDTYHSQAGHAVARACQVLGKECWNFYPEYRHEPGPRAPQVRAQELGALLRSLPAGRSCILYHAARRTVESAGGVAIPNALKLVETVEETSKEVPAGKSFNYVILPSSSGTIAAGVIRGFAERFDRPEWPTFLVHLGYSRSEEAIRSYLESASRVRGASIEVIDEGYSYKDQAKGGPTPPWPCNPYYDLKSFRWWMDSRAYYEGNVLLWNVG